MTARVFDKKAQSRIRQIIMTPLVLLGYKDDVSILFERINEGTFQNVMIGAVNNEPSQIVINIDWYENADDRDIKLVLRHEARHLYQRSQVRKLKAGQQTDSPISEVEKWAYNFSHYIPNTKQTEKQHFQQACELEAYVYSTYLDAVEHSKNGSANLNIVYYSGIGETVEKQVIDLLRSTPERKLKEYRQQLRV